MLDIIISPVVEVVMLESALAELRARLLREALLEGKGTGGASPAAEEETRQIVEACRAYYAGPAWRALFPEAAPETDPHVRRSLRASRDNAIECVALMHRLILETPVVGASAVSA
jgi:hypothetical protein